MLKRIALTALIATALTVPVARADWKQQVDQLDHDLEYEQAFKIAQAEYQKNPKDVWTNYWIGVVQMDKDKSMPSLNQARQYLTTAKNMAPEDPQVLCKYASVLGRIGNRLNGIERGKLQAEATGVILKAVKLGPNNTCVVGAFAVGKHYIKPELAEAEWAKLSKLDPKDYWTPLNWGRTLFKMKKPADAEVKFAQAVKMAEAAHLKPKLLSRFYFGVALFYEDFNFFDKSVAFGNKGVKVLPSYLMLRKAIKRFETEVATKKKVANTDIDMF